MISEYKVRAFLPSEIQPAGTFMADWDIVFDGNASIEDIVKPTMWANAQKCISTFATIRIYPRNQSYYAILLVKNVETMNTGVKLPTFHVLAHVVTKDEVAVAAIQEAAKPAEKEPSFASSTYSVHWKGSANKHCIIRNEDRLLVEKGISKKETAIARVMELEAA